MSQPNDEEIENPTRKRHNRTIQHIDEILAKLASNLRQLNVPSYEERRLAKMKAAMAEKDRAEASCSYMSKETEVRRSMGEGCSSQMLQAAEEEEEEAAHIKRIISEILEKRKKLVQQKTENQKHQEQDQPPNKKRATTESAATSIRTTSTDATKTKAATNRKRKATDK